MPLPVPVALAFSLALASGPGLRLEGSAVSAEAPARTQRIAEIQKALVAAHLDGWLFYDFRGTNPLAYRVLLFDPKEAITTRRWYYFIPAKGEPRKVVHAIEAGRLDALPGKKAVYLAWEERHRMVKEALGGANRVAMEYSPMNDIAPIARVDAGTVEFVRSLGTEVVSSGNLISRFESVWSDAQLASHRDAAVKLRSYVHGAFAEVGKRLREGTPVSEREMQLWLVARMKEGGLVEDEPIVAVNGNAANPHYAPDATHSSPIKKGDVLLIDISTKSASGDRPVCADITWMAFCGTKAEIPEQLAQVWTVVRDARDAAVAHVREAFAKGRAPTGAEVDDAARAVVKKAGFGERFLHRTGHSIGEEVHGNGTNIDNLESRDTRPILRRTCFSIEPGVYLTGKLGVRSEVDVYVGVGDGGDAVEVTGGPAQTEIVALLEP